MIPKLKIIQLANIIPAASFEESHVIRIIDDIVKNGFIRNLLSMASIGKHKYLSFEDSDGLEAIRRLGLTAVPAQIFDLAKDEEVEISVGISGQDTTLLDALAAQFPRQITAYLSPASGRHQVEQGHPLLALIAASERSTYGLRFHRDPHKRMPASFFHFLDLIRTWQLYRTGFFIKPLYAGNLKTGNRIAHLQIVGLFPSDLQFAALHGFIFPSGLLPIHPAPKVLGINYPLSVLSAPAPAREKERFLKDLFAFRLKDGHANYFRGGVYLLNG